MMLHQWICYNCQWKQCKWNKKTLKICWVAGSTLSSLKVRLIFDIILFEIGKIYT